MKTRTAIVLGTLICMTYSGVLGHYGHSWPDISLEDYFWGDLAVFFVLLMMRKARR